jgi:hypothetical protein
MDQHCPQGMQRHFQIDSTWALTFEKIGFFLDDLHAIATIQKFYGQEIS